MKEVKKGVSDLINSGDMLDDISVDSGSSALDRVKETSKMDVALAFDNISASSIKEAKKVLKSCIDFYYKESWISKNEYIQARAKSEELTLAGLYKQIGINNLMIEDLSKKILSSGMAVTNMARLYEVFAKLQEVNIQFSTQITMQVVAMDEQMKRLKVDHEFYQNRNQPTEDGNTEDVDYVEDKSMFKGQKDLMKSLKNKPKKEYSDINEKSNDEPIEDN